MSNYLKGLLKQVSTLEQREQEQYEIVLKTMTDESISQLNLIQTDIAITKSRIENYGKEGVVLHSIVIM